MSRPVIKVRLAIDSDGPVIRDLVVGGYAEACKDFNWSRIHPYWLIAETERDGPIGCIQTLVGYPTGCIEFLSFKKGLPHTLRAYVTKRLAQVALAAIYGAGCSAVFGTVPFQQKIWKNVMKKHWNATILTSGNMFFKRLDGQDNGLRENRSRPSNYSSAAAG